MLDGIRSERLRPGDAEGHLYAVDFARKLAFVKSGENDGGQTKRDDMLLW